jgi:hypothetical protein
LEDYSQKTGPLAVQEYIQELIRFNSSDIEKIIEPPLGCDVGTWQYEHIRQFLLESNLLVTQLQNVCNETICPVMRINNDTYKCTVHETWTECSAIDYMIHNLDSATEILLDFKIFVNDGKVQESEINSLHQIVKRIYRIFGHAMFFHQDAFVEFEKEMFLYKRFYYFVKKFKIKLKEKPINPFV